MKLVNALEASEGKINGPVYKYVKDVEECYKTANMEEKRSGRAGTLYYLSQYLDLNKFKTKSEPQKRKKASILLAFFRKNLNLIS